MRKPNGYGCIKRLSGNRRRPFVFVISENGKQKPVEYFTNQIDAEIFQADYNKTHNHRPPSWASNHIGRTVPSVAASTHGRYRAINIDNDSHARTKWGCIHQRIRFRTSVGFKRGNGDNH